MGRKGKSAARVAIEQKLRMRKIRERQRLEKEKERANDPKELLRKYLKLVPILRKRNIQLKPKKRKTQTRKNPDVRHDSRMRVAILKRMFKMTKNKFKIMKTNMVKESKRQAKTSTQTNKERKNPKFARSKQQRSSRKIQRWPVRSSEKKLLKTQKSRGISNNDTEKRPNKSTLEVVIDEVGPEPENYGIRNDFDTEYQPSIHLQNVIKMRSVKTNVRSQSVKMGNMEKIQATGMKHDVLSVKMNQNLSDRSNPSLVMRKQGVETDPKNLADGTKSTILKRGGSADAGTLRVTRKNTTINSGSIFGERSLTLRKRNSDKDFEKSTGISKTEGKKNGKQRKGNKKFEAMIEKIQADIDAISGNMDDQTLISTKYIDEGSTEKDKDSTKSFVPRPIPKRHQQTQGTMTPIYISDDINFDETDEQNFVPENFIPSYLLTNVVEEEKHNSSDRKTPTRTRSKETVENSKNKKTTRKTSYMNYHTKRCFVKLEKLCMYIAKEQKSTTKSKNHLN